MPYVSTHLWRHALNVFVNVYLIKYVDDVFVGIERDSRFAEKINNFDHNEKLHILENCARSV